MTISEYGKNSEGYDNLDWFVYALSVFPFIPLSLYWFIPLFLYPFIVLY